MPSVFRQISSAATAAALLWLLFASLAVSLLLGEREVGLRRAEKMAMAMTLVMEEHAADTFRSVSNALEGVADTFELSGPKPDDPAFRSFLRARVRALPQVRAIFVIGADGYIVHDTDHPQTPRTSLADREYFHEYVADESVLRGVSPVLVSRSGHGRFHAVTRRLTHEGRFAGVAVAAVVPAYFETLYRRMGLGEGQVIEMFHEDRTRVARYPPDDSLIGQRASAREIYGEQSPLEPAGTHVAREGLFTARMSSFRVVENWPFVVRLEQGPPSLLAAWRTAALTTAAGLLALAALTAAFVVQLGRTRRFELQTHQRLAHSERLEALGQLTGGMAHDFANLLGVLRSSLAIIEQQRPEDPRTVQALAIADRAIGNGKQLIEQLLRFASQGALDVRPLDVNATIRTHRAILEQAAGRDARVAFEPDEAIDTCLADETQLVMALVNLVVNARDAMRSPGAIRIRTARVDPAESARLGIGTHCRLRVTVHDPGVGMPEDVKRRAFDPFFTTKGDQGTGLGLAQVYGFMRQLGGDIRIDSEPGRGTAVHLYFPCAAQASATTPSPSSSSISSPV